MKYEDTHVFWLNSSMGNKGPSGSVLTIWMRDSSSLRTTFSFAVRAFCSSISKIGQVG